MSSFSLPSDKFYFRDKETEEPLELWTPYAGRADEASSAIGALKNTLDTLNDSIATINTNITNLESSLTTLNKYLDIQDHNYYTDLKVRATNYTYATLPYADRVNYGIYELEILLDTNNRIKHVFTFDHDGVFEKFIASKIVVGSPATVELYLVEVGFYPVTGGAVVVSLYKITPTISNNTVVNTLTWQSDVNYKLKQLVSFGKSYS